MSKADLENKHKSATAAEKEVSLKGTLVFVMFLGSFIFVTWFAIYFLYLSRI
ncbi:Cytochrome c oxidase subunit IIa family protein [Evansella caseinilytica]|uniref:Cytochrome c oxidase subunit IIa family protein n=1 Tax=Evansella caseinilytica TaxID=1503961 RepID=A0A1H3QHW8_9BACI|nr:cytochrome c oxidase subunit 2A [Evansella caseinilytica]SDZ13006.1 Cytochrome c oxidase subunit IIa family protein [Evansella caseinilytica]